MKPLIVIILFLSGQTLYGQFKIDANVRKEFDSLFEIQPKDIQEKRYIDGFDNGFALLREFQEDTLNIADYKPITFDGSIKVTAVDENGNKLPEPQQDTVKYNQWMSCYSFFINDTLITGTFFGLFSGNGFLFKIINEKVEGEYFEYIDDDSLFRHSLKDTKSKDIYLPLKIQDLTLSNVPKKLGDVFYAKAIIETEPFYQDNDEFRNGYIQKKYKIDCLFSCKVIKREK